MYGMLIFTLLLALALLGNSYIPHLSCLLGRRALFDALCCGFVTGFGRADWITSQETWVSVTEGRSVRLLCSYNVSSIYYIVLYWFRQYPNKAPEYILHRGWENPHRGVADFALERFYSRSTANSIDLQIKSLIPADTALYLCALASTEITSQRAATLKPQAEGMVLWFGFGFGFLSSCKRHHGS